MNYLIVGLGNPEPDYTDTRHNVGRMAVESFRIDNDLENWDIRKELTARISRGVLNDEDVTLMQPDDFMNNSGKSVAKYLRSQEDTEVIVVHDDIDLPIGSFRISYSRGSGGHNGVKSIENETKTNKSVRIRIGIAPVTFFGHIRKPQGTKAVQDYVLKKFTSGERKKLEKVLEDTSKALSQILKEGYVKAMNVYNSKVVE